MTVPRIASIAAWMVFATGCGMFGGGQRAERPPAPEPPTFMNRVWRVVEADDIPVGTYYAFISDNTLLVTPPGAVEPDLGRWHFAGGGLVIIEEGYRYPVDILESGPERFSIRIHRGETSEDVVMAAVKGE